ncbi:hypothetical protein F5Y12DRAFT_34666 [Xylaria sp. FL1777]|nr:hypothetical protein F5Y12DRAFT_34666 [Xylaria sp. FL1777]
MARGHESRPSSTTSSEAYARLLYNSLEKYNEAQRKRKRPSVILAALVFLFLSSAGGIALAIVLMAKVTEIEAACISRDFILFAGIMSLLYICLHIYGARRDYKRGGPRPPQMYGQYLHASAVLVARLGIVTWIAALVATVIMVARAIPLEGFSAKVPFLDLLLCVGAIPSFLIISVTIERNPKPFATASISNASFLTCRVSQFADDLAADSSVSRQSSLQRRQSRTETGSVLTVQTEEMLGLGAQPRGEKHTRALKQQESVLEEKRANLPTEETHQILPNVTGQPTPPTSESTPTQAVPQPTYCPGGWRSEWNSVAQEVGVSRIAENSTDESSSSNTSSSQHQRLQDTSTAPAPTGLSSSSQKSQLPVAPSNNTTANVPAQQHRYSQHRSTASLRLSGSSAPSNLSTVRYASEPEIAVQQSIRVVRNPAYRPRAGSVGTNECKGVERPVITRPDVALLRNAQRAQKADTENSVPKRTPSNFSRPLQKPGSDQDKVDSDSDSGGNVKIPGAFVEDENT